jgi:phosphatidylserine/phosphatidylglycerophosphate/cardiolipin synthase-like enzyme
VAFTGGLDLELSRWARHDHAGRQTWHDVVTRIEGPAAQGVYDHFKTMWDANLARLPQTLKLEGRPVRSIRADTPSLPARRLPSRAAVGTQTVTTLETLPAARYAPLTWIPKSLPFAEAPQGRFSYRDALKAAISRAREYVYIEDQLFWSREVMDWLNSAVRERPKLRVVLLLSGIDDPNDPPLPHDAYLCQAVNHHLLRGLSVDQAARVHLYRRVGVTVHAKTVVVDDRWASIGSCNIGARSLYTDVEHGIAVEDAEWVRQYRARLWSHHLGVDEPELAAWTDAEKVSEGRLERVALPLSEVPYPARLDRRYRGIHDPDSRRPWGGLLPTGLL